MSLTLQIVVDETGKTIALPLTDTVTVGRSPENRLQIDEPYLSERHAKIVHQGEGRLAVVDLDSTNGTYVNDKKIEGPQSLFGGDILRFGLAACRVIEGGALVETSDRDLAPGFRRFDLSKVGKRGKRRAPRRRRYLAQIQKDWETRNP